MAIGPFLDRVDQFDNVDGYRFNRVVDFLNSITDYSQSVNLPTSTNGSLPATNFGTLPIKFSSTTFTGGASSVTISLPTAFKHATFKGQARGTVASTEAEIFINFNGDSGSNYVYQQLYSNNNTAVGAQNGAATNQPLIARVPGSTATASVAGIFDISVNNYSGTTFIKEAFGTSQSFELLNVANEWFVQRGLRWNNTVALTSITIQLVSGNFVSGSTIDGYVWP